MWQSVKKIPVSGAAQFPSNYTKYPNNQNGGNSKKCGTGNNQKCGTQ